MQGQCCALNLHFTRDEFLILCTGVGVLEIKCPWGQGKLESCKPDKIYYYGYYMPQVQVRHWHQAASKQYVQSCRLAIIINGAY